MKFYKRDPDRALAGMAELTFKQRGAYNSLIDLLYSRDGKVPDDDVRVARMISCNWREWAAVKKQLIALGKVWVEDGHLHARRVHGTLKEASEFAQRQSARASKRWSCGTLPPLKGGGEGEVRSRIGSSERVANPENPNENNEAPMRPRNAITPTPIDIDSETRTSSESIVTVESQSKTPKPERSPSAAAEDRVTKRQFAEWWQCWSIPGTKRSKAEAMRAYGRVRRRGITHETLCLGVQAYMAWCRARGDPPDKIKHPTTWLNGGCWDDELPIPQPDGRNHGRLTGTSRAAISLLEDIRRRRDQAQGDHEADAELAADDEPGSGGAFRLLGSG